MGDSYQPTTNPYEDRPLTTEARNIVHDALAMVGYPETDERFTRIDAVTLAIHYLGVKVLHELDQPSPVEVREAREALEIAIREHHGTEPHDWPEAPE
jgi:hypothetical protein